MAITHEQQVHVASCLSVTRGNFQQMISCGMVHVFECNYAEVT